LRESAKKPLGPCPESRLVEDFKAVYLGIAKGMDPDGVTLFQIGSQMIPAHKSILAKNEQLEALCKTTPQKGPPEHIAPLEVPGKPYFSSESFVAVLQYIYYGEKNFTPDRAAKILPWTIDYGLKDLSEICNEIIEKKKTGSYGQCNWGESGQHKNSSTTCLGSYQSNFFFKDLNRKILKFLFREI
jgi:hypothetical protein